MSVIRELGVCVHTHAFSQTESVLSFALLLASTFSPLLRPGQKEYSWYSVNCVVSEWGKGEPGSSSSTGSVFTGRGQSSSNFSSQRNRVCFCVCLFDFKTLPSVATAQQFSACVYVPLAHTMWEKTICFDLICPFTLSICFHQFGIQMLLLLTASILIALLRHRIFGVTNNWTVFALTQVRQLTRILFTMTVTVRKTHTHNRSKQLHFFFKYKQKSFFSHLFFFLLMLLNRGGEQLQFANCCLPPSSAYQD